MFDILIDVWDIVILILSKWEGIMEASATSKVKLKVQMLEIYERRRYDKIIIINEDVFPFKHF